MTREELDQVTKEKGVTMKAKDIVPGLYSLPCAFEGGNHHLNPISLARWSEDGEKIVWMLDSHNFVFIKPDEERIVVRTRDEYMTNERVRKCLDAHTKLIATQPKTKGNTKSK